MSPCCHSRLGGNVLHKPLDSSFRWNDGGGDKCIRATSKVMPFAPSLQPVASRNDRFFCALPLFLVLCCLFHFCSIVIPAKAGIQEGGAGILNGFQIMFACTKVVIPARAEMYYINHWIPAFAGMTTGAIGVFGQPLKSFPSLHHYSLSQAEMTGFFVHCHSFWSSAVFFISAPSSFQRKLESRRAGPGY